MPRDGAIIFRDLIGKLSVLRIECEKCGRSGQYRLDRLIMRYGIDAELFEWSDEITADFLRKHFGNLYDQCGARCRTCQKWCSLRNYFTEFPGKARRAGTRCRVDACTLLIDGSVALLGT